MTRPLLLLFAAVVLTACPDGPQDDCVDEDGDGGGFCGDEDCDDTDPLVFPNAPELCNGIDDNCDGRIDEAFDRDGDGVTTCGPDLLPGTADDDCDDDDAFVLPGAVEMCNAVDDDCDGEIDEGFDQDHDGATTCGPDFTFGTADDDCDDDDPDQFPDNPDVCDGLDNDCDGEIDELSDEDGDGTTTCGADGVPGTEDDDCDDDDPDVEPFIWDGCDGVDVNCNGFVDEDCDEGGGGGGLYCYADADHDGWGGSGTVVTEDDDCDDVGESGRTGDCDDTNAAIHPGALETPNNGIDEDCDGADQQSSCDGALLSASEGEPNDSSSQTNLVVSADGHVVLAGSLTCGSGGDHDWFSVSFACSGPVTFELDPLGTSSTLQFEVTGSARAAGSTTASTSASSGSMVIHLWCSAGVSTTYEFFVDWD
jgi:hypothetical protein